MDEAGQLSRNQLKMLYRMRTLNESLAPYIASSVLLPVRLMLSYGESPFL